MCRLLGGERAKVMQFTLEPNRSLKARISLLPIDAFREDYASFSTVSFAVGLVLRRIGFAKVAGTVVRLVRVVMVNLFRRLAIVCHFPDDSVKLILHAVKQNAVVAALFVEGSSDLASIAGVPPLV